MGPGNAGCEREVKSSKWASGASYSVVGIGFVSNEPSVQSLVEQSSEGNIMPSLKGHWLMQLNPLGPSKLGDMENKSCWGNSLSWVIREGKSTISWALAV